MGFRSFCVESNTFCFRIPVRSSAILVSFLSMIISGILSAILWVQVATSQFNSGTQAAFEAAAVLETLYFFLSALGFLGTVLRKQLFVTTYAYCLYAHVVINLAILIWFIVQIPGGAKQTLTIRAHLSEPSAGMPSMGMSSVGMLHVARGVFLGLASTLWILEACQTLIIYYYLQRLKVQKNAARPSRNENSNPRNGLPQTVGDAQGAVANIQSFDPYRPYIAHRDDTVSIGPHPDPEQTYSGGTLNLREIADEEKRREAQRLHEEEQLAKGKQPAKGEQLVEEEQQGLLTPVEELRLPHTPPNAYMSDITTIALVPLRRPQSPSVGDGLPTYHDSI